MATGAPDWQGLQWKTEVAMRPTIIYPTGFVLFSDDFEGGSFGWLGGGSAGHVEKQSAYQPIRDTAHASLQAPGPADTYSYLRKMVPATKTGKLGLECLWTGPSVAFGYSKFGIDVYDGTRVYEYYLRYGHAGASWEYLDADDNFTSIPNSNQTFQTGIIGGNSFKVVIDTVNKKYLRLFSNNLSIDLSSLSPHNAAASANDAVVVYFYVYSKTAGTASMSYDNVVVTEE